MSGNSASNKTGGIFAILFDTPTTAWEEGLVATAYLKAFEFKESSFEKDLAQKGNKILEKLNALPKHWAKEICIETLEK